MKILLDTCVFIWLTSAPDRLSEAARQALNDADEIALGDVSIWEICLKWQAGKLTLPAPPRTWVEEQRRAWDLARLPLEPEHFYRSTELPIHHRDPFDRLLVSQAIVRGLTIATPDPSVRAYPVGVIW